MTCEPKSIAVMQPYVFPYIGYFQLINAVDTFVFYDDVNFIKKGWVNRNNILVNSMPSLITIPLIKASQNKTIKDIQVSNDKKVYQKLLKTIELAYSKAPYFKDVYPIVNKVIHSNYDSIASLAIESIKEIALYLDIRTEFKISSKDYFESKNLKREDRLIDICYKSNLTSYINANGGQEIYDKKYFKEKGIELNFLEPSIVEYKQLKNEFVPGLSIIDVAMFNSKRESVKLLNDYKLT